MDMQTSILSFDAHPFPFAATRRENGKNAAEQQDPPALAMDECGMILDCSKSFEQLFGFRRRDLVWQHVSRLLPQFIGVELVQAGRLNPFLNYLCHCGHHYAVLNRQGGMFPCMLSFVHVEFDGRRSLRLIINPSPEHA